MKILLASLLFALSLSAAGVSGKWSGNFVDDSDKTKPEPIYLVLNQDGNTVTGTAGQSAEQQMPIANGKIDGNTVSFDLKIEVITMHFSLTLADGHLKGKVIATLDGENHPGTVDLTMVE